MSRLSGHTTPPTGRRNLHLVHPPEALRVGPQRVETRAGGIQLSAHDDGVCIDVQARGYDVEGYEYRRHAYLIIDTRELLDLRDALTAMLALRIPMAVAA